MSYTKIWVHAVWGVKGRHTLLSNGQRQQFLDHVKEIVSKKEIEISLINCWVDHVHCLIRLKPEQNIAEVVQQIKKEAAHWINGNHLEKKRFLWSGEYYVASVSEGNLKGVKHYIAGQERQHAHRTYKEELAAYFETSVTPEFNTLMI